jgi:hypothetical protein
MVISSLTTVAVDLIDVITVTACPIVAMTIGIDEITAATTVATTDAMTIVATTGVTTARVIAMTPAR